MLIHMLLTQEEVTATLMNEYFDTRCKIEVKKTASSSVQEKNKIIVQNSPVLLFQRSKCGARGNRTPI
jgi:hypothetical protein